MCPFSGQELETKDKGCRGCWECILCTRSKSVTLWEAITISRGLSVNCACHYKLLTIPDRKMPNKSPQVKSIEATCRRIFHRGVGLWQNKKFAWFKCHFNWVSARQDRNRVHTYIVHIHPPLVCNANKPFGRHSNEICHQLGELEAGCPGYPATGRETCRMPLTGRSNNANYVRVCSHT